MEEEYSSLITNGTWKLVPKPPNRSVIKNRWIFKKKLGLGEEIRFKARLVAKGFTQRDGIDFTETFSPVVKLDSLRAVLAIINSNYLDIILVDVKTAFLNGDLQEKLYMEQPPLFSSPGKEDMVCLLKKSLYGLRQAFWTWSIKFTSCMMHFGLVQSDADPCVFYQQEGNSFTIVAVWVDDGIVGSSNPKKL